MSYPSQFCERHEGMSIIRRCCHCHDLFIAQSQLDGYESGYVDYVQDLPDGDVIVEEIDYFHNAEEAEVAWQEGLKRLFGGICPAPATKIPTLAEIVEALDEAQKL